MDDLELYRRAGTACHRWRSDRDYDDLIQTAVVYGWEHPELSAGTMVWLMRARAIDWLRLRDGRTFDQRLVELPVHVSVGARDLPVSVTYGLSGRDAVMAEMLSLGYLKSEVAERLGVHPSRVSQLLSLWRRDAARRSDHPLRASPLARRSFAS